VDVSEVAIVGDYYVGVAYISLLIIVNLFQFCSFKKPCGLMA